MRKLPKGSEAEKRIESFLEHNLELIEPGLRLLHRQYQLKKIAPKAVGKIDIFCQGSDGAKVAIELVARPINANDLGQVILYWAVLSHRAELHHSPIPRIYLIGPSTTLNFLHALDVLDGGRQINLTIKLFSILPGVNIEDDEWAIEVHDHEPNLKISM